MAEQNRQFINSSVTLNKCQNSYMKGSISNRHLATPNLRELIGRSSDVTNAFKIDVLFAIMCYFNDK